MIAHLPDSPEKEIQKKNVAIVLVSPKNPGNVGAVARAIKNMGFEDLRIVNPGPGTWLDAIRMACGAENLLEKAKISSCLKETLEDIQWVIGTTARKRRYHKNLLSPRGMAEDVAQISQKNKIAFLFGSEKYGLSTEEIGYCHQVVTIPTQKKFSSLNLSQAVMIITWELSQVNSSWFPPQKNLATQKEFQNFFTQLEKVLLDIQFLSANNANHMMFVLKNILQEKALTSREIKILRGIIRQTRRALKLTSEC